MITYIYDYTTKRYLIYYIHLFFFFSIHTFPAFFFILSHFFFFSSLHTSKTQLQTFPERENRAKKPKEKKHTDKKENCEEESDLTS